MKNMKSALTLGIACSVLLVAGCATTDRRAAADRDLEASLRVEVNNYGDLAAAAPNVRFHSHYGAVTLAGPVPSERDRQMLVTMVRNTPGVVAVNDELHVAYPPTGVSSPAPVYAGSAPDFTAPVVRVSPSTIAPGTVVVASPRVMASTREDEVVARRVTNQLNSESVPPVWLQNVTITVTGGNAYLQGTVNTQQQEDVIVDAARHAKGVKVVYDEIVLSP